MPNTIVSKPVNIYEYPEIIESGARTRVTEGDLHANLVKLIYTLVERGIAEIQRSDYERLVDICKKSSLRKEDLVAYKQILEGIKFHPAELRLLGDTTADRAGNDYLMLLAFKALQESGIKIELLLSNHDIELIKAYEAGREFRTWDISPAPSIERMQTLITDKLVTREEIRELFKNYYKPILNAIGYKLENNGEKEELTIYSHAPIGLNTIKSLAKKFKIPYRDEKIEEIVETINKINTKIHEAIQQDKLNTLYEISDQRDPLTQLVWNRKYSHLQRDVEHNGFLLNFVHGHDLGEETAGNKINLDNTLGKTVGMNKGEFTILYSREPVTTTSLNLLDAGLYSKAPVATTSLNKLKAGLYYKEPLATTSSNKPVGGFSRVCSFFKGENDPIENRPAESVKKIM